MTDQFGRDEVAKLMKSRMGDPGIFANAVTAGLQRPVNGAVAAVDFWNYPGSTMSDRFYGGMDAYEQKLDEERANTNEWSALAQDTAGGLLLGGPSGSLWKQAAYDAGTAGVQGAASGDSWGDIAGSMAVNAGIGGLFNLGGKAYGRAAEWDKKIRDSGVLSGW